MDKWVKNTVMLSVMGVWAVFMITLLIRGALPDPALWSVPAGVWLALNPPFVIKKSEKTQENE